MARGNPADSTKAAMEATTAALALGAGAAARLGRRRDESPAAARGRERAGQRSLGKSRSVRAMAGRRGAVRGRLCRVGTGRCRVRGRVGTTASGADRGEGAVSSDMHVK